MTSLTGHFEHRQSPDVILGGYAQMIAERVTAGWRPYLLSIMFHSLPGRRDEVLASMLDEIERVYRTFATRVVRRPASPASVGSLPVMIAGPDTPVGKRDKPLSDVVINAGLHLHGVLLVPPFSRLREPVEEHFRSNETLYLGGRRAVAAGRDFRLRDGLHVVAEREGLTIVGGRRVPLSELRRLDLDDGRRLLAGDGQLYVERPRRIAALDVRPVDRTAALAVGYALKSIKRGRFSLDDILVLPRAMTELSSKR